MDDFDTVTNLRSSSVEDIQAYLKQSPCIDAKDALSSSPPISAHHQSHDAAEDSGSLPDSPRGHYSSADDEAVFDQSVSRHSSPGTSHDSSDEEISVLLDSASPHNASRHVSSAPFTPSKANSPFHHPSSVRAMQLDTTPPHLATPSSQRKRFYTPSRQTSTPRSALSGHRGTPSRLMNSSPVKTVKKEHPLVLLHITLLPSHNYSLELLEAVLSPAIFANWKLLHERLTSTVLQRGILIPHPREDYDILEERVLESLGLKESRILKCGHFHLSPEEEADIEASEDEEDEDLDDVDICEDCGRRMRDGRYGDAGTGSKRWDVKVFAANGLMRAGAWSAAWREMERIDIELVPWMEESMKRELEQRSEEEERFRREQDALRKEEGIAGLDDERLREIYGQDASIRGTPAKEHTQDNAKRFSFGTPSSHYAGFEKPRSPSQPPFSTKSVRQQRDEIPLWELLRNYIYLAVQDPRNIAIWLLSITVLFLAIRSPSESPGLSVSTPLETSNPITSVAAFSTTTTLPQDSAISATKESSTTESSPSVSVSVSEALLLDDDEIVLRD